MNGNALKEVKISIYENKWFKWPRLILKEVKIALSVFLFVNVDLYLLQKWVRKNINWHRIMLREDADENIEHVLTKFKVRVTLNKDESHGLIDDWSIPIS